MAGNCLPCLFGKYENEKKHMSTEGLTMMLVTEGLVTVLTFYFFFRILFSKKKEKQDSVELNEE